MSEQEQQSSTEQTASTEATSTTETQSTPLEQVYEKFNVDAEAQSFQPQTQAPAQQTQQPQMPAIPDPVLDPNGFKTWYAAQNTDTQKELTGLKQIVLQQMIADKNRREAEEVQSLVAEANKVVGLPEEDRDLIEFAYAKQVRTDPKFAKIYAERHQKPAAWKAASKALNESLAKKYAVRSDPQLAENQRAIKQAQQSMATTKQTDSNPLSARLEGKNGADFQREWDRIVRGDSF